MENPQGVDLFLLVMTPLEENPNSIFVYMFLLLYGLGTWNEMHYTLRDLLYLIPGT